MSGLQKSVQDVQANSGTRLDTMSTQVQGLSDNLEEIKSRIGKLNQQLVDLQNSVQAIDARLAGGTPTAAPGGTSPTGAGTSPNATPPPLLQALHPPPTLSTPTAFAISPAANTISPIPNSRITSSTTPTRISPPTPNSISAKSPTPRSSTTKPSPNTKRSSPTIPKASSSLLPA